MTEEASNEHTITDRSESSTIVGQDKDGHYR